MNKFRRARHPSWCVAPRVRRAHRVAVERQRRDADIVNRAWARVSP